MAGRATPPFGCFFGERSLSLTLADFGTFRFFVSVDFFDTCMVLVSFHLIWAAIPIHPAVILIIMKGFAKDKLIVTRRKQRLVFPLFQHWPFNIVAHVPPHLEQKLADYAVRD
jgi:hypothetical protein